VRGECSEDGIVLDNYQLTAFSSILVLPSIVGATLYIASANRTGMWSSFFWDVNDALNGS